MADHIKRLLYADFGQLVHHLRKGRKKPMTQDRLGRLVGLSRTSITNIEKGRQHVSLHQFYRIADALGIAPEQLLPARAMPGVSKLAQMLPPDTEPEIAKWADSLTIR